MSGTATAPGDKNYSTFYRLGAFATMGWTMASPSVVLTYLAVTLDLPILVAGLLVTFRHTAGLFADFFGVAIAQVTQNRKRLVAISDCVVGMNFVLLVLAALYAPKTAIVAAFFAAVVIGSFAREVTALVMTDLISDNLQADSRRNMQYQQMFLAGVGVILLTATSHWALLEHSPIVRHATIIAVAIACFFFSAVLVRTVRDMSERPPSRARKVAEGVKNTQLPGLLSKQALILFRDAWFRKFILVRLLGFAASLSIPFFALMTAIKHEKSDHGLAALIISTAAAIAISSWVWRGLNARSNRLVLVLGASLVAVTGMLLLANHYLEFTNTVFFHAAMMFTATVAIKGVAVAIKLHFMEAAPKEQRLTALAVAKSTGKLFVIALSLLFAAAAHAGAITLVIAALVAICIATALSGAFLTPVPPKAGDAAVA